MGWMMRAPARTVPAQPSDLAWEGRGRVPWEESNWRSYFWRSLIYVDCFHVDAARAEGPPKR